MPPRTTTSRTLPGYVDNDGPKIVTSRFIHDDSYTLERSEATGGYAGLRRALETHAGRGPRARSAIRRPARSRRRRLPRRRQVGLHAARQVPVLPRGQRRRVRARDLQGPPPHGARPPSAHRGVPHHLLRPRPRPSASSTSAARWPRPRSASPRPSTRPTPRAMSASTSSAPTSASTSPSPGAPAPTSSARRPPSSNRSRATGACPVSSRRSSRPPSASTAKPTIVNNVETLSNLPWLMLNGAEQYKTYGSEASPGTRMIAVSGHVNRPGVYEIEQGVTTFRDLFYGDNYCQGIRDGNELKMFIPGGGSAPWFFPEQLDLPSRAAPSAVSRLDARLGRHRGDGRDDRRGPRPRCGWCGSTPASRAASAPRAARARPGRSASSSASSTAKDARATSTCCSTSPTTSAPARIRSRPTP